jgi:hypothetical protein
MLKVPFQVNPVIFSIGGWGICGREFRVLGFLFRVPWFEFCIGK